ncbi:MAG TPA: glycosyltransferase [Candidatus Margulisiibacteriota bacterium]|nr:glycosyltransferase [Candidatus Margulisiibacteriota bacterium]
MQALRILFVTPYVPSPVRVRPYNLIRRLAAQGHDVTVITAYTSEAEYADAGALRHLCSRVETVRVPLHRSLWNCARGLRTQLPLQALYACSPDLQRQVAAEIDTQTPRRQQRRPYDLLHVEHLRAVVCGLNVTGMPRVYDSVDCISRLFEKTLQMSATARSRLRALVDLERTRRFEGTLINRFERILTASEVDRESLAALGHRSGEARQGTDLERITVVRNGVDLEHFTSPPSTRDPATLVFVGRMRYHANVAAVLYFVRDVLPLIWRHQPDARLSIVGQDPPREVKALARRYGSRVAVTGTVPDVRPYVARATVAVSPLRYAVGIPNKILEAMAMATPVVTTSAGITSLQARDREHLLVADHADDFARQVLRLLDDPALQRRLGASGRSYVESHHDWGAVVSRLEDIYVDTLMRFRTRAKIAE